MLSVERWRQLEELFHQATALPQGEWANFARREAGHDPALLSELESMLSVASEATLRLRGPLKQAVVSLMAPPLASGTRCGPWAIEGLIGSGGMGRVYLGHRADGAYQQQVAIKLVANPWLDERQRAFFEFECRMQAQMHHPAIAQIYDAGLHEDERPYLVMEYIDGEAIDYWCAAHKASLDQRVQLVKQVCQGVLHAHQKGVIHRDLKPRNVLVGEIDGRPQPKIIDFGIAITGLMEGQEELAAGTPGYMSPEQASNQADIDVRSDVYSLGALLHQLLCGQAPSAMANAAHSPLAALIALPDEVCATAANACRSTPKKLRRALTEGLDAIVGKATDPDRSRRYDSVSSLLSDLDRWQRHKLPHGVPGSPWLVVRQFLRRHRLPAMAIAVVGLCALAGLTASLWALSKAHAQQQVAAHRRLQLERTVAFQQQMLQSVDVDAMGKAMDQAVSRDSPEVARDLLERYVVAHGLDRLQRDFKDDPALASELRQSLAGVLKSIGRYAAAAEELQVVLGDFDTQNQSQRRVMVVTLELADALYREGEFARCGQVLERLYGQHLPLAADDPLWLRAGALNALATLEQGHQSAALRQQLELERVWTQRFGVRNADVMALGVDIVGTLTRMSQREQALERMQELLPRFRNRYGREAATTLAASIRMAELLNAAGEYERSLALAAEVRDIRERELGEDHPDTLQAMALEGSNRVRLAQDGPAWAAAEEFMTKVLSRQTRVRGEDHPETLRSTADMIRLLAKQKVPAKTEQAIVMQRKLLATRERLLGELHPDTLFSRGGLASLLAGTDHYDEARSAALAALEGYNKVTPDHALISATWDVLARIEEHAGNLVAARDAHRKALQIRDERRGVLDAHTTESASRLYEVLVRLGDREGMAAIRERYLDPVIARDPARLNASLRSVREAAIEAVSSAAQMRHAAGAQATR